MPPRPMSASIAYRSNVSPAPIGTASTLSAGDAERARACPRT
jgi:hypothetical protein